MGCQEIQLLFSLLEKNLDKINWKWLSLNPSAVSLLEQKIEEDPDKINWENLSLNSSAVPLLENNPDKIKLG